MQLCPACYSIRTMFLTQWNKHKKNTLYENYIISVFCRLLWYLAAQTRALSSYPMYLITNGLFPRKRLWGGLAIVIKPLALMQNSTGLKWPSRVTGQPLIPALNTPTHTFMCTQKRTCSQYTNFQNSICLTTRWVRSVHALCPADSICCLVVSRPPMAVLWLVCDFKLA